MIVNSNRGISGIIDSRGRIEVSDNGKSPILLYGTIQKHSNKSFYAQKGNWLMILSCSYMILILITVITTKSKKT